MSKPSETSLLVPGARGWELWKQGSDGAYVRQSESESARAADLSLPGGHVTMLFPVKGWYALPFRAASADESLYKDLAAMHAERLGVRWDPMGGQLSDTFLVSKDGENSTLLTVVLKTPGEGELPPRTPKEFDLSARAFAVSGDVVAVWQEFGRWVFAFYQAGQLLYAQATSSEAADPDASVLREIKLAMSQMAMQGLSPKPQSVHVWSAGSNAGVLGEGLRLPAHASPRPDPKLPQPHSKLLPADVRAARREALARQQQTAVIAAVVVLYLGLVGWLGYGLYQSQQKAKALDLQARKYAPQSEIDKFKEYKDLWAELDPVVNSSRYPVDVMSRVVNAIPVTGNLRLTNAQITEEGISLAGSAADLGPINQFSVSLKQPGNGLSDYTWTMPQAAPGNTGYTFNYTATLNK